MSLPRQPMLSGSVLTMAMSNLKRPKRPPTAYNLFVKRYFVKKAGKVSGKEGMRRASRRWSQMSPADKQRYYRESERGKAEYQRAMSKYRQDQKALKGPPRPYLQFFQDFYRNLDAEVLRTTPPTEITRLAGSAWRSLSREEKERYTVWFKREYKDHAARVSQMALAISAEVELPIETDGAVGPLVDDMMLSLMSPSRVTAEGDV